MQSSSASDTEIEGLERARGISSSSSGCSSHMVGYNKTWEMKFPWLTPTNDFRGMCSKHGMCNKNNGSTVWSAVPCNTLRKDAVLRHNNSDMHGEAFRAEEIRLAAEKTRGIAQAMEHTIELGKVAITGSLKCLYRLIKQEIAHTTNYIPLLQLAQSWGCDFVSNLCVGRNATYTRERIVQEFIQVLASQIGEQQLSDLHSSSFISLMTDESTDIAVMKEL